MARVLLAEDEPQIGDMVACKLANAGHEVVRVRDGEAALAAAARERPDVIILDVMMPFLDGFAAAGRRKDSPDFRAIPVIMLTASGQERNTLSGLQEGASDYVVKPFSLKELLARGRHAPARLTHLEAAARRVSRRAHRHRPLAARSTLMEDEV